MTGYSGPKSVMYCFNNLVELQRFGRIMICVVQKCGLVREKKKTREDKVQEKWEKGEE